MPMNLLAMNGLHPIHVAEQAAQHARNDRCVAGASK